MPIVSIETTPNPNSMKLNLDRAVGKRETFTASQRQGCPPELDHLLDIDGVQSIFACESFVTLNRDPRADWRVILEAATKLLGGVRSQGTAGVAVQKSAETEGQVSVHIQTFRGIPIQVKVSGLSTEKRISVGSRFSDAAQRIQNETGADFLKERYWADWGVRYGVLEVVAAEVADEIAGTIDDKALKQLVLEALDGRAVDTVERSLDTLREQLADPAWHSRLRAVQELGNTENAVPLLTIALKDEHPQVRRLAAATLGASGEGEAVAPLCETLLSDPSPGVRRTAGDALSDLGDVSAQVAICRALTDANKLVRWRAARFLTEIGTEEALPHLKNAVTDSEFEVRLEIEAAIERISGGIQSSVPAWKRIVEST
jgi:hypothetical protein